jgi:hypothetical protein
MAWLPEAVSVGLTAVIGLLIKRLFNHMKHLREDVQELRRVMVDHLRDHGHQ